MRYFIIPFLFLSVIIYSKEIIAQSHLPNCVIKNNKIDVYDCDNNKTCSCKTKINFDDGRTYDGEWTNGIITGHGTMTYENGRKYVGKWKFIDDSYFGTGEITYENGLKYIGEWMDGQKHGKGTMIDENGNTYIGKWMSDKRNGQGKMIYLNGLQYNGNWTKDIRQGYGTLTYLNGLEISAYFSYGLFGYGIYKIDSILGFWDFILFWYYTIIE